MKITFEKKKNVCPTHQTELTIKKLECHSCPETIVYCEQCGLQEGEHE